MQFHNISTLQSHIVILTGLTIFLVYMLCMFVCMFVLLALTPSAYGLSLMLIKLCSVLFCTCTEYNMLRGLAGNGVKRHWSASL